jgi:hypothetical protein
MFAVVRFFLLALAFAAGNSAVFSQDVDDLQYKDDYDRMQQILKINNPSKRAEQLLVFYKGRSNMDPQIRNYADSYFVKDLESLCSQQDYALVKKITQGALAVRPKFAEAWLFSGVVLKSENKIDEAVMAFAKCYAISYANKSPVQTKAKQLFDNAYRAAHKGSLVGSDKLLKKVQEEMK